MKTKNKIWKGITAVGLGIFALTSCMEDPEPPLLDAVPDVFIQKKVVDDVPKYGVAFWVLGNKGLESVTVEDPNGDTATLESSDSNQQVFSLFPEQEDYTESFPVSGDYDFIVTSTQEGEAPGTFTDELEDGELEAMVLDTVYFEDEKLKTSWQSIESPDTYLVRLYDESENLIFMSSRLDDDETEYSFGLYDNGWTDSSNKPGNGDALRLEVLAILYESGATTENKDYNVQFISIAAEDIVWGE